MRIAIIGPVAPFRSGIARHTTALARELKARDGIELEVVSFARQYPEFLFPGERQADRDAAAAEGLDAEFVIDSIDPSSWRRVVRRFARSPPELAVIPAWTFFLAPCLGWIARGLRRLGVPVVMIVHNAEDHEAAWWKQRLSRFQLRQASRFLTHNAAIGRELARLAPRTPVAICPHPVYADYPMPTGQLPREAGLELLFFGLVRPYKGLDVALRALAAARVPDVRLTVAGEFWQGREATEALIRELRLGERVSLVPRYVSDQEAAELFARSDAVIVPYRAATGSGVVALAQWYGRPVIASDVPGLAQAIADGETGWLFPVGDVAALAHALETRVSRAAAAAMQPALRAARDELSWARLADVLLDPAQAR